MNKPSWLDYGLALLLLVLVSCLFGAKVYGQDVSGLDLPMGPVKYGDPPPKAPEKEKRKKGGYISGPTGDDEDDGDDPSDTPPPVFFGEEMEAETDTIVYVLDKSGSMTRGRAPYETLTGEVLRGNRWARALVEAARSIMGLPESFLFAVMAFDCGVQSWSRKGKLREATPENKASAIAWLAKIEPYGATGTGQAVAWSIRRDVGLCVLLTDGDPNCGLSAENGKKITSAMGARKAHRKHIRDRNAHHVAINVFGIACRPRLRAFCQGVATDSGGSYFDVP